MEVRLRKERYYSAISCKNCLILKHLKSNKHCKINFVKLESVIIHWCQECTLTYSIILNEKDILAPPAPLHLGRRDSRPCCPCDYGTPDAEKCLNRDFTIVALVQ